MIVSLEDRHPQVSPDAWVADTATVVGSVTLGAGSSVFYGAVVRADAERIDIGDGTNIQDGCVLHADPGRPLSVGSSVSVGHRAVLHGCTVEDEVLVGMGAIVMNGARIGTGSLVAAGALVPEGMEVPAGSLVLGAPAKVARPLSDAERTAVGRNALHYVDLAALHAGPAAPDADG